MMRLEEVNVQTIDNFGGTIGWTETVDIIPGVTDIEKLMQEPWGDEEPDLQETIKGEEDGTEDKDAEKSGERDEHRGESKWIMQTRLRGPLGVDGICWGKKFTSRRKKLTSKIAPFKDPFDAEQHVPPQLALSETLALLNVKHRRQDGLSRWRRGNLHNHPQNCCRGSRSCLRWGRLAKRCRLRKW